LNRDRSPFLVLWTLAVVAATAAFVLYLGLRVKSVERGYELGRAHARVARLREVKRVLELELASHKTPERVDLVARSLLGMSEPTPDRILAAGAEPEDQEAGKLERVPKYASDQVDDVPKAPAGNASTSTSTNTGTSTSTSTNTTSNEIPLDDDLEDEAP
jgi:cell division protein FtsL